MENLCCLESLNKKKSYQEYFGEEWSFFKSFENQLEKIKKVRKNEENIYILSGVHAPVFTLGQSLKNKELLTGKFIQTDRGGRVMYHGPGQLTLYFIFKYQKYFLGPKEYVRFLFDMCIKHFKEKHKINVYYRNNGLWNKENKKIGFVGLRIKNGISYHGFSLNYNTDLREFLKHSPCDISGDKVGNLFNKKALKPLLKIEANILMNDFLRGLTLRKA